MNSQTIISEEKYCYLRMSTEKFIQLFSCLNIVFKIHRIFINYTILILICEQTLNSLLLPLCLGMVILGQDSSSGVRLCNSFLNKNVSSGSFMFIDIMS